MPASALLAAPPTIERIAPEKSVLVMGTKSFQSASDHLKATPLWSWWDSDDMKALRADVVKKMTEGIDETLTDLGVEKDSLVPPAGPVGLALFSVIDPELGTPQMAFVALADYGNAENAEKIDSIVRAALDRGEREGHLEYDEQDVQGRKVYVIDISNLKIGEEEEEPEFQMFPTPKPRDMVQGIKHLHYVRDGNTLLFSSSLETIAEAIDVAQGRPRAGGSVADREDFRAVTGRLGENDGYAVLLTRDIGDLLGAADQMGMIQMMRPTLRALVGEVHGYGFSVRFDAPTAMMEQVVSVYMPRGKQGLTKLVDAPVKRAPGGALPPFVAPDAVSYNTFTFHFSGVMDLLRRVVASNPFLAAEGQAQLDMIAPTVEQITSALGSQVHVSTTVTRPFTATSRQTIIAIEAVKPQEFDTFMSGVADQMGLESRDFLGQRIYTLPAEQLGMMMPIPTLESISLGIGGGYVFVGPTMAVEQGLRAVSEPAGATLSGAAEFQRAIGVLTRQNLIGWGYTDTVESMESSFAVQRAAMEKMIQEMREDAAEWADEEDIAEMEAEMRGGDEIWEKINFDVLRRYLGPSSWEIQSTEDGFIMRSLSLSARQAR